MEHGIRTMSYEELIAAHDKAVDEGCDAVRAMLVREVLRRATNSLRTIAA